LQEDDTQRNETIDGFKQEYDKLREGHLNRQKAKSYRSLADARENKFKIDWDKGVAPAPIKAGITVFEDYDLAEIREMIDWTPFFYTWELKGRYPKIFEDEKKGPEAKKLFADANEMLDKIIAEKWLQAKAIIGLFPANSINEDDIEVYDESRSEVIANFYNLRQQADKNAPNISLTDFLAPKETGLEDHMGGFAVTAGLGIEKKLAEFEADHDDYKSIMLKALADRLAEAFAELMHRRVRKEFWGYDTQENFSNEELIREAYSGIRPAPGYPANPDHTEKLTLWDLLDVEEHTGITLTENLAMYPTASVSGLYLSHPESRYFGIGKLTKEQVEDYAKRKGMSVEKMERWLGANLAY
ncbi:MAG: vitamin B12 dependent-methionine synthase activation domain-containing protein, partial [Bacteroidota bacterium]